MRGWIANTWTAGATSAGAALSGVLLIGALVLAAPGTAGAKDDWSHTKSKSREKLKTADFEWTQRLARGQTLEIKGVNGEIIAESTDGDEVTVTARKHSKRSDPDEVRIEAFRHDDGLTVCAVYPGKGNDCEAGDGWHSHTQNNDVVVDFRVLVPRGVRFVARTVNGGVEADGLDGPVEAYTVNGSVLVESNGTARAETVNGSITARVGSSRFDEELEFQTVNGSITLECPSDIRTAVSASTLNGDIVSDFPLMVKGRVSRRKLEGRIGEGGAGSLKLSTVNGEIRLRAAD